MAAEAKETRGRVLGGLLAPTWVGFSLRVEVGQRLTIAPVPAIVNVSEPLTSQFSSSAQFARIRRSFTSAVQPYPASRRPAGLLMPPMRRTTRQTFCRRRRL